MASADAPNALIANPTSIRDWDARVLANYELSAWVVVEITHWKRYMGSKDDARKKLAQILEDIAALSAASESSQDRVSSPAVTPQDTPQPAEGDEWNHEFLLVKCTSTESPSSYAYITIERTTGEGSVSVARSQLAGKSRRISPTIMNALPSPTIRAMDGATQVVERDVIHIATTTFPATPSHKPLPVYAFALLCKIVSDHSPDYMVLDTQCYWYSAMIEKLARLNFDGCLQRESHFGWKGKFIAFGNALGPFGVPSDRQVDQITAVFEADWAKRKALPRQTMFQVLQENARLKAELEAVRRTD
jgi:hypothetical protein